MSKARMWTRYDSNTIQDPMIAKLSRSDRFLYMELLAWANDQQTDGFIERSVLRRMTDIARPAQAMTRLCATGCLQEVDEGWTIVHFFVEQLSNEEVTRRHEKSQVTSERNRRHNAGDHSKCDPKRCWALKGVTGHVTPTVTGHDTIRHLTTLNDTERDDTPEEVEGEEKESSEDEKKDLPRSAFGSRTPASPPLPAGSPGPSALRSEVQLGLAALDMQVTQFGVTITPSDTANSNDAAAAYSVAHNIAEQAAEKFETILMTPDSDRWAVQIELCSNKNSGQELSTWIHNIIIPGLFFDGD